MYSLGVIWVYLQQTKKCGEAQHAKDRPEDSKQ